MSHIVFHLIIIIFISLSCSSPPPHLFSLPCTQQCAINDDRQNKLLQKKKKKIVVGLFWNFLRIIDQFV